MKFTATVTIGRNIGNSPMLDGLWQQFRDDVEIAILNNLNSTSELYTRDALTSAGQYKNMTEESSTFVFGIELAQLAQLRPLLYNLAGKYEQDCIALVIGHTDLVGPRA